MLNIAIEDLIAIEHIVAIGHIIPSSILLFAYP